MGNKQTIFTDEQLDAYQVSLRVYLQPVGECVQLQCQKKSRSSIFLNFIYLLHDLQYKRLRGYMFVKEKAEKQSVESVHVQHCNECISPWLLITIPWSLL